jgi:nitroimidazol reductase NimA-like FMN-containing flavoprotein (pyridoxamine 5'-phosphate oxidase superfamily)
MLDIDEMGRDEIVEILMRVGYGHLGFNCEGKPYVMPMHYYLDDSGRDPHIYLFTTEGMKTQAIDKNPEVCLQVEEVFDDPLHWRSVIVNGTAKQLKDREEIERVREIVKQHNPTLSPAINRTWTDSWGRAQVVTIYQIEPIEMTGRTTDGVSSRMMVG